MSDGASRPSMRHLSMLGAWALAFGCAVGSDAFVMPWSDFLPKAGPLGTVLGVFIGGLVMAVVAWNFHYMINRWPGPGGDAGVFRLDVEDTGCGISEEDQKRIGSAYVQVGAKVSRNGGTGLGLAICRQLAAAMGGSLEMESTLGEGSTFSVVIPEVKVAAAPDAQPFDLVLTDMWMPNLDGEGLVKAIRASPALSSLRVVAVTADVESQGTFAAMGFDDLLLKPVTVDKLGKILTGDRRP